jgi:hypothetical protein
MNLSNLIFVTVSNWSLVGVFYLQMKPATFNRLHHSQMDIFLDGSLPLCTTSSLRRNHRFRFVIPQHICKTLETPLSTTAVLALLMARVGNSSSTIWKLDFITHLKAFGFHSFVFLSVSNIMLMPSIFQRLVCVTTNSLIRRRVTSWSTWYLYLWPYMSGNFKMGLPEKYF